jgi:hypothetical protein
MVSNANAKTFLMVFAPFIERSLHRILSTECYKLPHGGGSRKTLVHPGHAQANLAVIFCHCTGNINHGENHENKCLEKTRKDCNPMMGTEEAMAANQRHNYRLPDAGKQTTVMVRQRQMTDNHWEHQPYSHQTGPAKCQDISDTVFYPR